jgi:hypothetical protein
MKQFNANEENKEEDHFAIEITKKDDDPDGQRIPNMDLIN